MVSVWKEGRGERGTYADGSGGQRTWFGLVGGGGGDE